MFKGIILSHSLCSSPFLAKLIVGSTKGFIRGKALSVEGHIHDTGDLISGVLPLIRGGTGVTTIAALKSALGISSSSNLKSAYFYIQDLPKGSSRSVTASFDVGFAIVSNPQGSPGSVSYVTRTNNSSTYASISGRSVRVQNTSNLNVAYDYSVYCIGV